ncbi:MAG: TauD/TfdA family dioxygenase [Vulcanimicrobiaceae bacterium]|jgi:taurine dioxygenase
MTTQTYASPINVKRTAAFFGAEITGVDLSRPLDTETRSAIESAWHEYLVLCFPDQHLTKTQLLAFAENFEGELDDFGHEKTVDPDDHRVLFLSSKPEPGKKWDGYKQGAHWHSDRSYTPRPATGTFVYAKEVPEVGGDTLFANQYLACETLSPKLAEIVRTLSGIHSQANLGHSGVRAPGDVVSAYRKGGSAIHSAVKTHPATGREALYVGERVRQFVGMTEEESRPLVEVLNRHAVRHEFLYRHRWRVDDLVMWDNRALMHYAPLDYDPQTQPRFMWRCSLVGPRTGEDVPS